MRWKSIIMELSNDKLFYNVIYHKIQNIILNKMSLKFEQYAEASVPLLISVTEVENTLSSKKYVIYYEIPAFPNTFRSIDNLEEIFLPSPFFKFKILNL